MAMDEFSKKVSAQIFSRFPEWECLAETANDEGVDVLSLKVPSLSDDESCHLTIDTFQGEVTVSFDAYHAHFCEFEGEALPFINQLISDDYAVVSYWRGEQWCGSTLLPPDDFPATNKEYPYANRIKIRSWSGKLNDDIKCTPTD